MSCYALNSTEHGLGATNGTVKEIAGRGVETGDGWQVAWGGKAGRQRRNAEGRTCYPTDVHGEIANGARVSQLDVGAGGLFGAVGVEGRELVGRKPRRWLAVLHGVGEAGWGYRG